MILYRNSRDVFPPRSKFVHVTGRHQSKHGWKCCADLSFRFPISRLSQILRNARGVNRIHFFHSTHKHDIVDAGGNCDHRFAHGGAAGCARCLGSGGRNVGKTHCSSSVRRDMVLIVKAGGGKIAQVKSLDHRCIDLCVQ